MKIAPKDIDRTVKALPAHIAAVLVYGPDEGLVRERMNLLTRSVVPDPNDPFGVTEITAAKLSQTPSALSDEALSISMLGDKKVIRVPDATDSLAGTVEHTLNSLGKGSNLVLLAAGELSPRSKLRLLFEQAENAAAIPCYVDDERSIARIISEGLRDAGYHIPPDAVTFMAAHVVGDRAIARSEVEKLVTYMGDNKRVTLEDVTACVGNSADLSMDDIAKNVAGGNFAEADRILTHTLAEGTTAVAVLRSLQNYFMRLHMTKARLEQGASMDSAVKQLRPPLFFKMKEAFEHQSRSWSLPQLETALTLIASAEAKSKQTASNPDTLCGRLILSLAHVGARACGRRR